MSDFLKPLQGGILQHQGQMLKMSRLSILPVELLDLSLLSACLFFLHFYHVLLAQVEKL